MLINATQFVERSQFFNGQRLFASDLQELEAFSREMRWLHNQSLHQPGIGSGYVPTGKKGGREITIGPGYALDAFGREIVLTQTHTEPVPPVASDDNGQPVWYDLTVSYPSDSDLKPSETREGICLPRGAVRLREEPVFCWVRLSLDDNGQVQPADYRLAQQLHDGLKIVVARAEVFNCQLERDLCTAQRRNARPATQPYIACDHSSPTWKMWKLSGPDETEIGFQTSIDTSKAKFKVTPCYLARLEDAKPPTPQEEGFSLIRALLTLRIENPSVNGFDLRAYLPMLALASGQATTGNLGKTLLEIFKQLTGSED
jgi:hypothetical protein